MNSELNGSESGRKFNIYIVFALVAISHCRNEMHDEHLNYYIYIVFGFLMIGEMKSMNRL